MKDSQLNYTTPEQSKRLLELGVPAGSADCYYTQEEIEGNMYWFDLHVKREYQPHTSLHASTIWGEILPCWSVGQLMEIFETCTGLVWQNEVIDGYTKIDILLEDFEDNENKYHFDFSKLEDFTKRSNGNNSVL